MRVLQEIGYSLVHTKRMKNEMNITYFANERYVDFVQNFGGETIKEGTFLET
jgi:hypothetical protein